MIIPKREKVESKSEVQLKIYLVDHQNLVLSAYTPLRYSTTSSIKH
jgi:hypothetical protein